MKQFEGRVWRFGDNIPTDRIVSTALVVEPLSVIRKHVLETLNPDFPAQVQPGDIIVAGRDFGQSSGRAIAVKAIQATGVSCVIADSLSRTFYRNCFEVGFTGIDCPGITSWVADGDRLRVDIEAGTIESLTNGNVGAIAPVHPLLRRMLEVGGIIAMGDEFDRFGADAVDANAGQSSAAT